MKVTYDEVELKDVAEHYNESLARFNSCYDLMCQLADKPAMIDIVEAIARHSADIAKDEAALEQLGVAKADIQKVVFDIVTADNSMV